MTTLRPNNSTGIIITSLNFKMSLQVFRSSKRKYRGDALNHKGVGNKIADNSNGV